MSTADLSNLLLAYLAFALMIISPGPNNLAVIASTVAYGRQAGTAVALGISSGSFTWAILTAAGLSAVLAQTAGALLVIKIAGGLYLLWLAFKSWRDPLRSRKPDPAPSVSAGHTICAATFCR